MRHPMPGTITRRTLFGASAVAVGGCDPLRPTVDLTGLVGPVRQVPYVDQPVRR